MKTLTFNSKKHGAFETIVDDIDYERLKKLEKNSKTGKWCVALFRNGIYFQKRLRSTGKLVMLHRWIMGAEPGQYVDHISRDTLDNRRSNLRICTNAANIRNGKVRTNNKSGYTGVGWSEDRKKWVARIRVNYKIIYLGRFSAKSEAVRARKRAERKYFSV